MRTFIFLFYFFTRCAILLSRNREDLKAVRVKAHIEPAAYHFADCADLGVLT